MDLFYYDVGYFGSYLLIKVIYLSMKDTKIMYTKIAKLLIIV